MNNKKNELVLSAIALVKVGEALEAAKGKLRTLVEQGVPYESGEMKKHWTNICNYSSTGRSWKQNTSG